MRAQLEEALTKARVDHKVETYPAKHGWVFRDVDFYDAAASERNWKTMIDFFDAT
jgi:carboxymethylenebutenolidase